MNDEKVHETEEVSEDEVASVPAEIDARPNSIMANIDIEHYAQFLYTAGKGDKAWTAFNSEGIKVIGLNYGISTGPVSIEFLDEDKTHAIFSCESKNRQGDTASANVEQFKKEFGKDNPHWITKGTTRARTAAIKALLPVQLLQSMLSEAIAAGKIKKSEIQEIQKECTKNYEVRSDKSISKKELMHAAEEEFGATIDSWDASMWKQFAESLKE